MNDRPRKQKLLEKYPLLGVFLVVAALMGGVGTTLATVEALRFWVSRAEHAEYVRLKAAEDSKHKRITYRTRLEQLREKRAQLLILISELEDKPQSARTVKILRHDLFTVEAEIKQRESELEKLP